MKYCTNGDEKEHLCYKEFRSAYDTPCIGAGGCNMWGGNYNTKTKSCDWSGGKDGADEFDACPDLKGYSDGKDCDPACTLTGGYKTSADGPCRWSNINNGQLRSFS